MASSDKTLCRTTILKKLIHSTFCALYLSVILAAFGWWLDFSMGGKLDDMNATMNHRLDDMSANMNSRLDVVHQDIRQLEQKMDRKFEQMDRKFELIDRRLDTMDNRFLRMELSFEGLNEAHKSLVPTVRRLEVNVAELTAGER